MPTLHAVERFSEVDLPERFEPLERIGRGGSGAVYRVRDRNTQDVIALKRLEGKAASDRNAVARFRREFHTLARLRHPAVVRVIDWIESDLPLYTMELVEGVDLQQAAPLPWVRTCAILQQLASALALLHVQRLVHRDVSPRNIRIEADGGVTLLDFGAVATAGTIPELVVGTPPMVAPEALQRRPLDHRTDVYALGAVAYFALTGRHAHPATRLDELWALWTERPPLPSSFAPDVPPALDELVMRMLARDSVARPAATELVHALNEIAELGPMEVEAVSHGYLSSASLVGRAAEMELLQAEWTRVLQGESRIVVVEGRSGFGKSRLVYESALSAQVQGLTVVRTLCSHDRPPYDVLDEIVERLTVELPPAILRRAEQPAKGLLGRIAGLRALFPGLAPTPAAAEAAEERIRLQTAFAEWLECISGAHPLLLVLDDAQRCDDVSAAVLASLAQRRAEHAIGLVLAVRTGEQVRAPAPLRVLRAGARVVSIGPLDEAELGLLVQAVFGDVERAPRLAKWLAEVSDGTPLSATETLRDLVDRQVVRYERGTWVLPESFGSQLASSSLRDAMARRVAGLSPLARELGEALAVAGVRVPLDRVFALSTASPSQTLERIDELVLAEVLIGGTDHYAFRHDAVREALLAGLDADRRAALHRAVAASLMAIAGDSPAEELQIGLHLHDSGDALRAAPLLERAGRHLFKQGSMIDALRALRRVVDLYAADGPEANRRFELCSIIVEAGFHADRDVMLEFGMPAFEALVERCGVPSTQRMAARLGKRIGVPLGLLSTAFTRRRSAVPMAKALEHLAWLTAWLCGAMSAAFDLEGSRRMCAAIALFDAPGLSRSGGAVLYYHLESMRHHNEGEYPRSLEFSVRVAALLERGALPEREGQVVAAAQIVSASRFVASVMEGHPSWLEHLQRLRDHGVQHILPLGVMWTRHYHFMRGEASAARRVIEDYDRIVVRAGMNVHTEMVWRQLQLTLVLIHDDKIRLRTLRRELRRLAPDQRWAPAFDRWAQPFMAALSAFLVDGDPRSTLQHLEGADAVLDEFGTCLRDGLGCTTELAVRARLQLGEHEAALALAPRIERLARGGQRYWVVRLTAHLAKAHLVAGDEERARSELDAATALAEQIENPALCGWIWELRAELAAHRGDEVELTRSIERLSTWYEVCDESRIRARRQWWRERRTLRRIRDALPASAGAQWTVGTLAWVPPSESPAELARRILDLLAATTGAEGVFVYRREDAGITCQASLGNIEIPPRWREAVEQFAAPGSLDTSTQASASSDWQLRPLKPSITSSAVWGVALLYRPRLTHDPDLWASIEVILGAGDQEDGDRTEDGGVQSRAQRQVPGG